MVPSRELINERNGVNVKKNDELLKRRLDTVVGSIPWRIAKAGVFFCVIWVTRPAEVFGDGCCGDLEVAFSDWDFCFHRRLSIYPVNPGKLDNICCDDNVTILS
ncbi:hypothetical protein LOAG_09066 [Loa loa]|uniref:Uncharacterized protein n=1 Tax=Loa loa TaxID=7209 RepID=A0A1S0TSD2_LOALO|nr:hypothetical protein LOAG_09066 [Loa loa]EFO19426.1 hypothetical protein LOAG_09066 [Loa loa]